MSEKRVSVIKDTSIRRILLLIQSGVRLKEVLLHSCIVMNAQRKNNTTQYVGDFNRPLRQRLHDSSPVGPTLLVNN